MNILRALAVAACCALVIGGESFAADRSNVGCGIGTQLFEGKEGTLSQACAATTNGILGNQTFGITFGTLDCSKPAAFSSNERLQEFVGDNMANLAMDMSRGNGEYLTTLVVLMDVPIEDRARVYGLLQANFSSIYTSDSITQFDVLNNIESVMSAQVAPEAQSAPSAQVVPSDEAVPSAG